MKLKKHIQACKLHKYHKIAFEVHYV